MDFYPKTITLLIQDFSNSCVYCTYVFYFIWDICTLLFIFLLTFTFTSLHFTKKTDTLIHLEPKKRETEFSQV